MFKHEAEQHYMDFEIDVTEITSRGIEGVAEMKIQSEDWLRRMKYPIQALKIKDPKAQYQLNCKICNYSSF